MQYAFLYLFTVVLVNWSFDIVPLLSLPGGEMWSPVSLVVGFVFVIRDYAQRAVGHYVLAAMLAAGAASWFLASPETALASLCAFMAGEVLDWGVYSFTGRPFSQRVLLSSAIGTPFDSAIFLGMLGIFSIPGVLIMTASKMLGAFIVFWLVRRRENTAPQAAWQ